MYEARTIAGALALACGCLLSLAAAGRPAEQMTLPDWSRTPVEDRDLGHGVHMLESFGGNIGVLAGNEGVLLIDAEWPQLHDKVLAAVSHISPKPIRYLVNTHWHWDHVGADGLFAKAGAVIFSSGETREYIAILLNDRHSLHRVEPVVVKQLQHRSLFQHDRAINLLFAFGLPLCLFESQRQFSGKRQLL